MGRLDVEWRRSVGLLAETKDVLGDLRLHSERFDTEKGLLPFADKITQELL